MSVDVLREVFNESRATGSARCVLVALADAADPDNAICWLPILPSKRRSKDPRKCITHRARCDKRTAIRALAKLQTLGELEVRTAKRGRTRFNVYRLPIGEFRARGVDYEQLPWPLDDPFSTPEELSSRGDNLTPRQIGEDAPDEVTDALATGGQSGAPRGDSSAVDEVTSTVAYAGAGSEPPIGPAIGEPSAAEPPPSIPRVVPLRVVDGEGLEDGETAAALPGLAGALTRLVEQLRTVRGWDDDSLRIVEPLAMQLPPERVALVVEKVRARRKVSNPAGLLVHLLRVEQRELSQEQAAAAETARAGFEQLKRTDPEAYVLAWARGAAADAGFAKGCAPRHMLEFLFEYVPDDAEKRRLADVFVNTCRFELSASSIREWIVMRSHRYQPAEVHEAIETFTTAAPAELRRELHELADELRSNVVREAGGTA